MSDIEIMEKLSGLYKEKGNILGTIKVLNKSLSESKIRLKNITEEITELETELK
jgi:predicted nuclease with TOPRIM domain